MFTLLFKIKIKSITTIFWLNYRIVLALLELNLFLWTINLRSQIILMVINQGHVMSAMFCWSLLRLYISRRGLSWTEYLHAYKKEHFWQILFSDKGNMLWNNVVLGSIRYVWSRQCSRSCVQRFGNVLAKLWGITWCKETASVISLHMWESLHIHLKANVADPE